MRTPLRLTSEDLPSLCCEARGRGPPGPPGVLAVVGGSINKNALKERTAEARVPADSYATTTVEDVAASLVAAAHGRSAGDIDTVEDAWLRTRIRQELTCERGRTLATVATLHGEDIEALVTALKAWWRATDGGSLPDQRQLSTALESVPTFHRSSTETLFEAFDTLTDRFEADLTPTTFLSRSHLVRAARGEIDHWNDVWPSIDQIYIGSISVLDNAMLRFIVELAAHQDVPPITFCTGAGTLDRFHTRVEAAAEAKGLSVPDPKRVEESKTVAYLCDIARGAPPEQSAEVLGSGALDVECITVPRRRDEMAYVMQAVGTVEAAGGRGSQVMAVAPDAGEYEGHARSASRRYNIPVYVETRFSLAHTPLVRAVKTTLELVAAVQPTLESVLQPLQYGALPAGSSQETPLRDAALAAVREEVATEGGSLDNWVDELHQTTTSAGQMVEEFVEMVRAAQRQAVTGGEVERLVRTIVENYPTVTTHGVGRYQPNRVGGSGEYPSDRTRRDVLRVGQRTTTVVSALKSPSWSDVAAAFADSLAGAGTGRPNTDAMAVQLVDAGNAYFRRRPWVIVSSLSEGAFPRVGTAGSLIPDTVRTAVAEFDDPHLYFDSEEAQIARAVDEYHAALRCATERVTLLRPGRDAEGREQPASRFGGNLLDADTARTYGVDYHAGDGFLDSVEPAQWLETPPASTHERLSVLGLNAAPTPAGQQAVVRDAANRNERLVDIAMTLDERTVDEMDTAVETLTATLDDPVLPTEVDINPQEDGPAGAASADAD